MAKNTHTHKHLQTCEGNKGKLKKESEKKRWQQKKVVEKKRISNHLNRCLKVLNDNRAPPPHAQSKSTSGNFNVKNNKNKLYKFK